MSEGDIMVRYGRFDYHSTVRAGEEHGNGRKVAEDIRRAAHEYAEAAKANLAESKEATRRAEIAAERTAFREKLMVVAFIVMAVAECGVVVVEIHHW